MEKQEKKHSKKPFVFIAFTTIAFLVAIILFSLFRPVSTLAIWTDIGIHCEDTGEHAPDGLAVRLYGEGYDSTHYTADGHVQFGSGLVDGTYTIEWFWGDLYVETVTIECSQIWWYFDYYVPNPDIYKQLLYDTPYGDYPPIVEKEVFLYENGGLKTSGFTDAEGWVHFGGDVVAVCKDYYLEWMWGDEAYTTDIIHFGYEDCKLCILEWRETNYLPAKSGGDKMSEILTLAESDRFLSY